MTPKEVTVAVEINADAAGMPGAPLADTTIVVETPSALEPTKVLVHASAAAPIRHGTRSWLGWLRSLIEGIVTFVKTLVPLITALA